MSRQGRGHFHLAEPFGPADVRHADGVEDPSGYAAPGRDAPEGFEIVRALQVGGGGNDFIAMELIEEKTLRTAIGDRPLPLREALRLAVEIAEGLAGVHHARVIHRDLKPVFRRLLSESCSFDALRGRLPCARPEGGLGPGAGRVGQALPMPGRAPRGGGWRSLAGPVRARLHSRDTFGALLDS